jgi:hypothetical protein
MSEPNHRTKLNTAQIETLRILAKFRFGSNDLLAQYFGKKDRSFIVRRLSLLVDRELIAKRFDSSYRIKGKPAAYYLTPAGARRLQEYQDDKINVKATYRDEKASEDFIEHCIQVFAIRNRLKVKYGDTVKFFTKADLDQEGFDYFPRPLPDAYISLQTGKTERLFFLEVIDDNQPFFTVVRRIKQYMDYDEGGEWDDTGTSFPTVLFACSSDAVQKRLTKHIGNLDTDIRIAAGLSELYI